MGHDDVSGSCTEEIWTAALLDEAGVSAVLLSPVVAQAANWRRCEKVEVSMALSLNGKIPVPLKPPFTCSCVKAKLNSLEIISEKCFFDTGPECVLAYFRRRDCHLLFTSLNTEVSSKCVKWDGSLSRDTLFDLASTTRGRLMGDRCPLKIRTRGLEDRCSVFLRKMVLNQSRNWEPSIHPFSLVVKAVPEGPPCVQFK